MTITPVRPKEIPISKPELRRIYEHIGGDQGLTKILHDFYHRMETDILIGYFFDGKDVDDIADKQKAFLSKAMGATSSYGGKAPAQAHNELPEILAGHFDRRLRILEETLRDHAVAEEDIRIWLGFESAFREGIQSSHS